MKRFLNRYTVIILSFYAFWIIGVPLIFSGVLPGVCVNLSLNSGYSVEIKKPRLYLSLLPSARIKAESFDLKQKDTDDCIKIKNPEISIRLLPLLSGRLHINTVSADGIYVNSVLENKPVLDKNFLSNAGKMRIKCNCLNLEKIEVNIHEPELSSPVKYTAENIYFKKNAFALKMYLSGKLKIGESLSKADINLYLPKNNNVKKSVLDITLDNFDAAPLGDYLRHYLPDDLADIKGVVNIKADKENMQASFENFSILMKDTAKSVIFPEKLDIDSKFNVTGKDIAFEEINIKSGNINAVLSGDISNYLDKSATMLNMDVRLNKSRVEDIVALSPPIIIEELNVYKLKKYGLYGDVIGNFSIKGGIYQPDVNGEIYINNVILSKPIKNAGGATIKLDFAGKYLNFDALVPAGGLEKVWVKGGVELYNVKYSDMRIWSTKNVNLKTAEEKIIPIHEILNFIIGPVPIMDIAGNGNIDIVVKGNRKNPHIWGTLNLNDVTTHFDDIPDLVLTDGAAVLKFNDQNTEFKTQKALLNGKPVEVSGGSNLFGKFDFDAASSSQEIKYLYNAIQTSAMLDDVKKILPKLDECSGLVNLKIKVYGLTPDIEDIQFNRNLFAKGNIELLGNTFNIEGMKIHETKGKIDFDGLNANADIEAMTGRSGLSAKASLKNNYADISLFAPNFNLKDILNLPEEFQEDGGNIFLDVSAEYKGKIDKPEYDKINFTANILGSAPDDKLKLSGGSIELNNDKLKISNLRGSILNSNSSFKADMEASSISEKPRVNGFVQLKSFDLTALDILNKYPFMPDDFKKIKFDRGTVNFNCRINNGKVNAYSDLGGISFTYTPMELPIKILNGSLIIKNNTLKLNKINLLADGMPVLFESTVNDIFKKQNFDIYLNSKPKQEFIEKYINRNQIYPLKIKGDIVYSLRAKGVKDNYDLKADVNMAKDSSIYHLGATVGDVENAIIMNLDTKILNQNILKIKEFSYDKVIPSLGSRETRLPMLKAKGGIEIYSDDLVFHDLFIKTQNPADVRIFNIIFRKPNIKQGQFTSDLKFNGRLSDPKLLGDFHIFETNIPFLDTTMKNITFKFKDKTIELSSKGEILGNDITFNGVLKNKLTIPYYVEKADLQTKFFNLNYIADKIKLSQAENAHTFESFEGFDLSSLVIKDINLRADNIYLRNLTAKDFQANASIDENGHVNVKDFNFSIASGILKGMFNYNLNDDDMVLSLKAKEIDANDIVTALFDLKNQMFGDLTGDIEISCNGEDFDSCMKTLNGKTTFNISDGRIPKLGSLEYLLKAGNLVKGGITGLSINSVIDIITPLKTGDFSNIYGNAVIKDGVAEDIEIATSGRDLSIFISGNYNFSTAEADMEVLGMLSKKISTMFGPIGNFSLNTLFNAIPGVDLSKDTRILEQINKIPGIELSSKAYRKFIALIKGNINGDDYVTSFSWIN